MTAPKKKSKTESIEPNEQRSVGLDYPNIRVALDNPIRWEIFDTLTSIHEGSISDIAQLTARARTSIYHHVNKLLDAELIYKSGKRLVGKRNEQLYRPKFTSVYTHFDKDDIENIEFHVAFAKTIIRSLGRKYEEAAHSPEAIATSPSRNFHCGIHNGWFDKKELAKLNVMISDIWRFCNSSSPGPDKQLVHVGIVEAFRTLANTEADDI